VRALLDTIVQRKSAKKIGHFLLHSTLSIGHKELPGFQRVLCHPYNEPLIFVVLSKFVKPLTFNDDNIVVSYFNVVNPLTFNDENNNVLLFNVVKPPIFNEEINVGRFRPSQWRRGVSTVPW
jgi:hypothetical protein